LRELEIIGSPVHPRGDMARTRPRVQPGAQGPECAVVWGHGALGLAIPS